MSHGQHDPKLEAALEQAACRRDEAYAWYAVGVAAYRAGDWWKAREALERAIAIGHDTSSSRGELGQALMKLGERTAALAQLERALPLATDPTERCWALCRLGHFYVETNRPERALECFSAAVEADPEVAYARQGLGAAYVDRQNYEAALPHMEAATRLAPHDPGTWYALGEVRRSLGYLDGAQEALERAIATGYPDGKARARLAWVYQQQGRARDAAAEAKRALRHPLPKPWRRWVAGIVRDCKRQRR